MQIRKNIRKVQKGVSAFLLVNTVFLTAIMVLDHIRVIRFGLFAYLQFAFYWYCMTGIDFAWLLILSMIREETVNDG